MREVSPLGLTVLETLRGGPHTGEQLEHALALPTPPARLRDGDASDVEVLLTSLFGLVTFDVGLVTLDGPEPGRYDLSPAGREVLEQHAGERGIPRPETVRRLHLLHAVRTGPIEGAIGLRLGGGILRPVDGQVANRTWRGPGVLMCSAYAALTIDGVPQVVASTVPADEVLARYGLRRSTVTTLLVDQGDDPVAQLTTTPWDPSPVVIQRAAVHRAQRVWSGVGL